MTLLYGRQHDVTERSPPRRRYMVAAMSLKGRHRRRRYMVTLRGRYMVASVTLLKGCHHDLAIWSLLRRH